MSPSKSEIVQRLTYTGASDAQVRWGNCADSRPLLQEGKEYDVLRSEIHKFHTKVFLVDHPTMGFNSACFDEEEL